MIAEIALSTASLPKAFEETRFPVVESKSFVHRFLTAAALADRPTAIRSVTRSEDILATRRVLESLGARIRDDGKQFFVTPVLPEHTSGHSEVLTEADCGESGTTLRLLLPVAAALGRAVTFTGCGRLPERPLSPLTDAMAARGVRLSGMNGLPLTVSGRLPAGDWALPADVSSQFVSGLLTALAVTPAVSRLTLLKKVESAPYIAMTLAVLKTFGAEIAYDEKRRTFTIKGRDRLCAPEGPLSLEGDWSNGAFWCAATGLVARRSVRPTPLPLTNLNPDSIQGDRAILDILALYGIRTEENAGAFVFIYEPEVLAHGGDITVDVSQTPDLLPVAALFAAAFPFTTRFVGAARLRLKESDRLASVRELLLNLGIRAQTDADSLTLVGGPVKNRACVSSCGDHRLVMAAALSLFAPGDTEADGSRRLTIEGALAVNKSYPDFFGHLAALGARLTLTEN